MNRPTDMRIVTAVNAHDELVTALRALVNNTRPADESDFSTYDQRYTNYTNAMTQARAILAKVGEK